MSNLIFRIFSCSLLSSLFLLHFGLTTPVFADDSQGDEIVFDDDDTDTSDDENEVDDDLSITPTSKLKPVTADPSLYYIVSVVDNPFPLKNKFFITPRGGLTVLDPLIEQYVAELQLSYYFSDMIGVGLTGQYFLGHRLRDAYLLTARHVDLVAAVNKYNYGGMAHVHLTPFSGKFSFFNTAILYWNTTISVGVAAVMSETIPRLEYHHEPFNNISLGSSVALSFQLAVTDWFSLSTGLRHNLIFDTFEAKDREAIDAKTAADSQSTSFFTENLVLHTGLTFRFGGN